MEAERDDERKRQRGSVLICWQEGMLEDKQRQSRSAQEAERERKRKEPYWLQSLLPQQPSWTINVWWFTSAKIYTQTGLQGHPRILRKASQDVFRNVQSKATGLPFYLQPKTLSFKSSSKNVNFKDDLDNGKSLQSLELLIWLAMTSYSNRLCEAND